MIRSSSFKFDHILCSFILEKNVYYVVLYLTESLHLLITCLQPNPPSIVINVCVNLVKEGKKFKENKIHTVE
jgi:hypothetical protein